MSIEFRNVYFSYDNNSLFENISFRIERGETVFLVGPNGGGKTTIVKIILGILQPSSGIVLIDGKSLKESRLKIGYLPQILSHNNISDKIKIPVYEIIEQGIYGNMRKNERKNRIDYVSEKLGIEDILYNNFNSLSGGQKQKVLLARALVIDPDILILDEPNTGLDYPSQSSIFTIIEDFRNKKDSILIVVTHDFSLLPSSAIKLFCVYKSIHVHNRPNSFLDCPVINKSFAGGMEIILHGSGKPHRLLEKH